ncbi:helix-turn-helix domain-containing protein [Streptomyces phaeochromogenes]|uniref:helix-turn-helix domain-containing protein n=1 Tax=Streptomyces phaeochromogenes TaxID=1923 RepID=UPI00367DA5B1
MARPIVEDMHQLAGCLLQGEYDGAPLKQRLELVWQLVRELEDYAAAAVTDARRRGGASWQEVAAAAQCAPVTARNRWRPEEVERRLARRTAVRQELTEPGQTRISPPVMPRRTPTDCGTSGRAVHRVAAGGPARARLSPAAQLADALNHLHRVCGKTIRALAREVRLSPSYVSRVLSGQRLPSWSATCRLAKASHGEPGELRALWESARGIRVPAHQAPGDALATLQAALRGLHLSAARPTPTRLCRISEGRLTADTAAALIHGTQMLDWDTVARFVTVLSGRPADIRPLWEAAYAAAPVPASGQAGPARASTLFAGAFG